MAISPKRILCVEDDEFGTELLSYHLSRYKLVIVTSKAEGLRVAEEERFDLVLIGGILADGNGIELCRQIRQFDQETPIMILSGDAREVVQRQALTAGAQDFIIKPIDFAGLMMRITTILL